MKAELELTQTKPEIQECSDFKTAKLPKLVISKFDGSFMDWPRFWGQFNEAIDKSSDCSYYPISFPKHARSQVKGGHSDWACDWLTADSTLDFQREFYACKCLEFLVENLILFTLKSIENN